MASLDRLSLGAIALALLCASAPGLAQEPAGAPPAAPSEAGSAAAGAAAAEEGAPPRLPWQPGPLTAEIGDGLAEIDVPEGYVFMERSGTLRLLELTGNLSGESELATLAKADDSNWFVIFEWAPMGWVDDSDREKLDPEGLLAALRKGTEASNEERKRRGFPTFEVVGWNEPPHYDPATNNLTWAIEGKSEEHVSLNRMVKLLGRHGVMSATLVSSPEQLPMAKADVDRLLGGYRFRQGNRYAEYLPGKDKAAEIGLGALVIGGGAAALVKTGLLAKLWKPIAGAAVVLFAAIQRFFGRGKGSDAPVS